MLSKVIELEDNFQVQMRRAFKERVKIVVNIKMEVKSNIIELFEMVILLNIYIFPWREIINCYIADRKNYKFQYRQSEFYERSKHLQCFRYGWSMELCHF